MDLRENVEGRIRHFKEKLEQINMAAAEEMNKAHDQRHVNLLHLLYLEKEAHSLALDELETLLRNSGNCKRENSYPAISRERIHGGVNATKNGGGDAQSAKQIYRILTYGGIGDGLLLTPAIRELKRQNPGCRIKVYCHTRSHKEVLMNNKYIDRLLVIGGGEGGRLSSP